MKQRQAVTAVTGQRYRNGSKKVKQQILNEFCETTGYCRGYARFVLRNHGAPNLAARKKSDRGRRAPAAARPKPRYYNEAIVQELVKLWELLNYSCGKRLVAIMPELIAKLEQFGELRLAPSTKEKLLRISATAVDRLLQPERRNSSYADVLIPSLALYSNTRSQFAPLPSGMSNNPGLRRLIWWPMMVAWHSVTIAKHLI